MLAQVRGRDVIDFGCGEGAEAVELAQRGANVLGIDLRESVLGVARRRAEEAGVSSTCRFSTRVESPADIVISIDAFEHFSDPAAILRIMHDALRPGGVVLAAFGPTWYHPYGGHLFSVFPWAHLLFSERSLIAWRSRIRSDGATRFSEVEGGLNQMTIRWFESLAEASSFKVEAVEPVPIRRLARFHNRLTREFFTSVVRARLRKGA
jgi:SAM-dependent methyltransferase